MWIALRFTWSFFNLKKEWAPPLEFGAGLSGISCYFPCIWDILEFCDSGRMVTPHVLPKVSKSLDLLLAVRALESIRGHPWWMKMFTAVVDRGCSTLWPSVQCTPGRPWSMPRHHIDCTTTDRGWLRGAGAACVCAAHFGIDKIDRTRRKYGPPYVRSGYLRGKEKIAMVISICLLGSIALGSWTYVGQLRGK